MMEDVMNRVRLECARLFSRFSGTRIGIVSSVDPSNYRCRVMLQPENKETGWLPITTPWLGNTWGIVCPPSAGDVVEVQFQEGDLGAGFVVGRFYSNATRAPSGCPSGEFWLVHKTGSVLKFHNDGTIEMIGNGDINVTAPQVNMTAPTVNITGNLVVTGNITADQDIFDQGGADSSLNNIRTVYNEHVHGGSTTPTPQLP